ncbi:hypothetical protein GCM10009601_62710 [Streptomyces thermospinosisporus]|uniref:SUKH-4 immunity protein of toxin-antitoxin system n=2 Tax=Streptomyces thermospinosisporus TaxID=161482 RepID=A0ABP4JZ16_9ACTN
MHHGGLMTTTGTKGIAALTTRTGTSFSLALAREFGRGGVYRFEEVDFPATLTHEPTRRFLSETGLPEDGGIFALDTELPLRTLTEYYTHAGDYTDGYHFQPPSLPTDADHLIRLGSLLDGNSLLVHGTTGEILHWNDWTTTLRPLNADVATLAFALWLLHRRTTPGAVAGIEPA